MRAKLGLADEHEGDRELIEALMPLLANDKVDWTIFWRRLSRNVAGDEAQPARDLFLDRESFGAWLRQYEDRLGSDREAAASAMLRTNPKYVLRNHLGELAIQRAKQTDFSAVETLLAIVHAPIDEHPGHEDMAGFPPDWAQHIEISCST